MKLIAILTPKQLSGDLAISRERANWRGVEFQRRKLKSNKGGQTKQEVFRERIENGLCPFCSRPWIDPHENLKGSKPSHCLSCQEELKAKFRLGANIKFTLSEFARILGMTPSSVGGRLKSGKLPQYDGFTDSGRGYWKLETIMPYI
ncbi:hypothetical protein [Paenibacillus sp. 1-18]|uniref:hypothetical protein n=1 Tax=Paenibacillus sp. 1-18 TaxID=1333846 RepID=UPI0018CBFFD4|nr:hypothetical protein [Paenibacillus sp. 1-18]